MTKSKMANRYSPEVRARAVRMVFEHQGSYETQAGAIAAIAPKIGCIPQTLSGWVKQAEKDSGMRDGVTTGCNRAPNQIRVTSTVGGDIKKPPSENAEG